MLVSRAAAGTVTEQFAGANTWLRVLLSVALIAPPALGMGLCFPLGLRLVERAGGRTITPWLRGSTARSGWSTAG